MDRRACLFFFLLSILYAMIINTPIYYIYDIISCARCRCYSVTERCMQMQWTIGLGHGVGDWQRNPGHSQLPGTFQMLCVHLLSSSIYFLCLKKSNSMFEAREKILNFIKFIKTILIFISLDMLLYNQSNATYYSSIRYHICLFTFGI